MTQEIDKHKTRTTWTQDEAWKMYQMLTHLVSYKDGLDSYGERMTRRKMAVIKALSSADDLLHALYEATEPLDSPASAAGRADSGEAEGAARYEVGEYGNKVIVSDRVKNETKAAYQYLTPVGKKFALGQAQAECNRLNAEHAASAAAGNGSEGS